MDITNPDKPTDPVEIQQWRKLFYNTSLGLCIACPLIALLPPRKMDLYTFGLGVTWFTCAGYVVQERTGQGILWHLGNHIPSARNAQRMEEMRREAAQQGREIKDQPRGILKSIWMAGERDDWVEERARKEKEALEEGRGYGGLIMDQVKGAFKTDASEEEIREAEVHAKEQARKND